MKILTAIARTAARLCDAHDARIYLVEGATMRLVAQHGSVRTTRRLGEPFPVSRGAVHGRAVLTRRTIHVRDLKTAVRTQYPDLTPRQRATGTRTILAAPLLSGGAAVGVIMIRRVQVNPFTSRQIALLNTFADQAVIAIEKDRLVNELEVKNHALVEALEQQTATGEILRVIASSATELSPVFEAVVASAARLCEAPDVAMLLVDGDDLRIAAGVGALYRSIPPDFTIQLTRGSVATRAVMDRATIHIDDLVAESDEEYPVGRELARRFGHRTMLAVPLLREGVPIGVICAFRLEVRPFPQQQIALLKTFADQAVIAIENVRLFKELETRNADLTEALEQQTATSEILRVISSSPTDLQPVLDTVVKGAARFCGAYDACIFRLDGDHLRLDAHHGPVAQPDGFLLPVVKGSVGGRTVLERRIIHVADLPAETTEFPEAAPNARRLGFRTILSVPLVREGVAIGAIQLRRPESVPFSDKQVSLLQTFSDQAVIAIENVRLFKELEARNRDLTEALEQQTATSEILRVISSSQTDVQPVFDAIVESAVRLLGGHTGELTRIAGNHVELAALTSTGDAGNAAFKALFPRPLHAEGTHAEAIRDRAPVNLADAHTDPRLPETLRAAARARGFRSRVVVPMLHHDEAVGALAVTRREPGGFTQDEIALLRTFADQAVIAIENVRLFTELRTRNREITEALEQQTATSEVLKVISRSTFDLQPVLDTLIENAARLCDARRGVILRRDGDSYHGVAFYNASPELVEFVRRHAITPGRHSITARVALERRTIHVADLQADPEYRYALRDDDPIRTELGVPMFRGDDILGVIILYKLEVQPFTDKQIELVQTFADQAVIAIENVRLFKELEGKNRAFTEAHAQVTEALEQQMATGEILRTIAHAQTDAQPVFDTIVRSAARLCHAANAALFLTHGGMLYEPANYGSSPEALAATRARYPRPVGMDTTAGMAVLTRSVIHVPDAEDPSAIEHVRQGGRLLGFRSMVTVPMLREGEPVGAIIVTRRDPGRFSDADVELLKTFADQAVIAVENVRLFTELEARTAALTRSVEQLTALGEVGRAVSSTLDLETVLTTIVSRAVQLSGLDGGVVFEYDESAEEFVHRAATETGGALAEARRSTRIRAGEGVVGRTALTLEPVQVPDITVPGAHESRLRENLIASGVRAVLAVPMVYEGRLIGSLVVSRNRPGDFPPETIELLRTFATQSALAIQNARLFREIADKSRQLEAASRHKSEFLANMSHELRTPLNAIIGFSEVLAQGMFGDINEKQTEYLQDILESGRHLLSLINDILDLSKIEAGRMELEPADFDLPSAIENALTLVRERASRRGIRLDSTIDKDLGMIRGDERKVKQVLLNLLSNALKFTPEGGQIDIAARLHDDRAEVAVADTGVGIAPEDQEAVFEEFRQVGTADKKAEGTGLGLALSRKFIDLHGGRIWVTSQVGVGSTFTFTLPLTSAAGTGHRNSESD